MIDQIIKENIGIEDHETPGYQHHDGLHFEEWKHLTYKNLAQKIVEKYCNKKDIKILELGCGAGSLTGWIRKFNSNPLIVTADGNVGTVESPYIINNFHFIIRTDRDYHFVDENGETILFDIILCYEHLEHIEEKNLEQFLTSLNKHVKNGTIFLGTASINPYDERVHVNVKKREEWNGSFSKFNWKEFEDKILDDDTKPFNFNLGQTNELNYIKE